MMEIQPVQQDSERTQQQFSNNPQHGRRAPKLRSSCDNCSSAKVRCDQKRPSCQRCFYSRVQCVYSMSRRMGKPPNSARNANGNEDSKKAAPKTTTTAVQTDDLPAMPSPTKFSSRSSEKVSQQQQTDTSALDEFCQEYNISDVDNISSNFISDQLLSASIEMPLDDQMDFSNVPSASHGSRSQHSQANGFSKQMLASMNGSEFLDSSGNFHRSSSSTSMGNYADEMQSVFHMLPASMETSGTKLDHLHRTTSCIHLASSILHRLSIPFSFCTTSPTSIPPSTIDTVLDTSRQAMTAFYTLLQCPCSQTSSSALSLAHIILKILDCYCAVTRYSSSLSSTTSFPIAQPSSGASRRETHYQHSQPSSDSTTPSSNFTQNMLLDTPITIGAYKIDADDEHRVILHLLQSELRKVARLVEAFAGRYCTTGGSSNRNSEVMVGRGREGDFAARTWNSGEESIHAALEQFLRSKLYATKREVNLASSRNEEGGIEFGS